MTDFPAPSTGGDEFEELLTRSMNAIAAHAPTALPDGTSPVVSVLEQRRRRRLGIIAAGTAAAVAAASVGVLSLSTDDGAKTRRVKVALGQTSKDQTTTTTTTVTSSSSSEAAAAPVTSSTSVVVVAPKPRVAAPSTTSTTSTTSAVPAKLVSMHIRFNAPGVKGRLLFRIPGSLVNSIMGTSTPEYGLQLLKQNPGAFITSMGPETYSGSIPFDGSVDVQLPAVAIPETINSATFTVALLAESIDDAYALSYVSNTVNVEVPIHAGANDLTYDATALGIVMPVLSSTVDPAVDMPAVPAPGLVYERLINGNVVARAIVRPGAAPFMMPGNGELSITKLQYLDRDTHEPKETCVGDWWPVIQNGGRRAVLDAIDVGNLTTSWFFTVDSIVSKMGLGSNLACDVWDMSKPKPSPQIVAPPTSAPAP